MKRKLYTKEDWDHSIDTPIDAFNQDELKIFLQRRRASDEQLESWKTLLKEEDDRLRASIDSHPDSIRIKETHAIQEKIWEEADWLKANPDSYRQQLAELDKKRERLLELMNRPRPDEAGCAKRMDELRTMACDLEEERERLRTSMRLHPDSQRLDDIDNVQQAVWTESDKRAGIDDKED